MSCRLLFGLPVACLLSGCLSAYDSARMLPQGKTRVTTSGAQLRVDEEETPGFNSFGLRVSHGVSETTELGAQYEKVSGGEGSASLFGVGAKFALTPNRLAVVVPFGVAWEAGQIALYSIHPRLIGSVPAGRNSELTGSLGMAIVIPREEGDTESYLGGSVGVRLSTDLDVWAFHPEIGFMEVDGVGVFSLGAAVSFTL